MKIRIEELKRLGKQAGFTHIAPLDCSTIKLLPEVRQMCASNACHMYDKNCPALPAAAPCRNVKKECKNTAMEFWYKP